ncbi:MAG TPA: DUF2339 domain-containing protein [Thermoanaerobaculia bacterium]|nr:DUF2339 domain-containing protein [Thermoanaerobaculia bacterium]
MSLEERLGAHLPVWIGSIALALAGAFLVKYSFERGLLSPAFRVALGIAFGLGLLAGGELMRRSNSRVSQGLSAAGVADLFACFLAGVHLYGLISPAVGFVLMALTTAVAVILSLRQGPMVALIGLVGGFLAPYWVRSGEPSARNLFGYLLLLEVGLLTASRRRGWSGVAFLALGSGLVWILAWLAGPFQPADALWLCLFLLFSVFAAVVAALSGGPADWGGRLPATALGWGPAALGLVATALVAGRAGYSTTEWVFFGLLAAGTLFLGAFDTAYAGLAWVAAGTAAVLLGSWTWKSLRDDLPRYLWTTLALGLLFAVGGYLAALYSSRSGRVSRARAEGRAAARRGLWMALSAASALVFFLIAYGAEKGERLGVPWGPLALACALLYVLAAAALVRLRGPLAARPRELAAPLAALCVAATTFVSLAAPLELERAWMSVAWALEVPALFWLAGRFRLPVLTTLGRALAVMAGVRLLLNPEILAYPIGERPLFNWLLYGYGVPLAAFAAAAVAARRQGDERSATGLEGGALAFGFALVSLEICQVFHPGHPGAGPTYLAQWAALTAAWLLLGWGALAAADRMTPPRPSLAVGGRILVLAGLLGTALGPGLAANPLWEHRPVGETPIANGLLALFGLPAALLLAAARHLARRAASSRLDRLLTKAWSGGALALLFVLVSLEVRQLFHGSYLDAGTAGAAERYAYSAAWILFGTALLVLGIARRGRALRYASLAVMMIAVVKVFLYDTKNLSDLYRVFSFLGLGGSLLLLAYLYQRFVFRESGR